MARTVSVRCSLIGLLVWMVSAALEGGEVDVESPFGVVCPWPGVQQAGVRWCRVGAGATAFVNWPEIEKSPLTWDWTAADNEIKQLADPLGLSLLPIFGYTPKWASRAPEDSEFQFHPPKDVAHFARFVGQCVARYKHRVKVWEVWNEPNIDFFRGSAAEYAEMVKAAAVAARREDPHCRIAMGCAGVDLDFLERLYEFGCGPYFDVMSVHPYQWGRQLNDGWMIDKLQGCRRLMDRHGDKHKEIWITEIGWSLAEGVTPQEQADLLGQAAVTALSVRERLGVAKVFWFCVKDWGGPGYGLFDVAGQPKPALFAYQAVTTALAEARYQSPWKGPAGTRGHVFDRAGQPVLAAWTPSPDDKIRVELKTSAPKLSLRTIVNQTSEVPVTGYQAAVEFAANSFVERQYLHKAENSGCSDSIRFGSEFGYRFDLRNMRSAQLRVNVGANGANEWNLLISKDDDHYVLERSDKSWPSWQAVALDKYLAGAGEAAGTIYVKIQGTDCQVREVVLEAEAEGGLRSVQ